MCCWCCYCAGSQRFCRPRRQHVSRLMFFIQFERAYNVWRHLWAGFQFDQNKISPTSLSTLLWITNNYSYILYIIFCESKIFTNIQFDKSMPYWCIVIIKLWSRLSDTTYVTTFPETFFDIICSLTLKRLLYCIYTPQ